MCGALKARSVDVAHGGRPLALPAGILLEDTVVEPAARRPKRRPEGRDAGEDAREDARGQVCAEA